NHLWAKCREAASALLARGVGEGDRIAIWAPNSREWVVAAVAAMTCGAAIVPLNTRLKGREAGDILRRTHARMMFTVRGFLGIDYPELLSAEDLPDLAETVLLDTDFGAFLASGQGADDGGVDAALSRLTADHLSDILFTSGTTGVPKGVMMTYGRVIPQCGVWIGNTGLKAGERYLIVNPFFHSFGFKVGWVACLISGAVIVPAQQPLPAELRPVAARFPVTLYTGTDCAPCDSARQMLRQRGIPFAERSVTTDDDIQALQRMSNGRTLPTLAVGQQILRGWLDSDWAQTLDLAGYPKESRLPRDYSPPPATPLVARAPEADTLPTVQA
ncbi:MAG: hypothetical protein CFE32_20475, partial [Alphaproteobacteria bacterium PA3]